jgi:hypothetical protein
VCVCVAPSPDTVVSSFSPNPVGPHHRAYAELTPRECLTSILLGKQVLSDCAQLTEVLSRPSTNANPVHCHNLSDKPSPLGERA